mgnify:CR=1 FL=1
MIYFFIGLGILLLGLVTLIIIKLKELKEIVEELVFVSCNELSDTEKGKLNGIADFVIAEKHDEYDFGSYKRGYFYLKPHLKDFDELIFANDSCFGPLYPLREIFGEMETAEKCDFWGITKNRFGLTKSQSGYKTVRRPHIQSYFLVLKKTVFTSKTFDEFMESIRHHDEKNEIGGDYYTFDLLYAIIETANHMVSLKRRCPVISLEDFNFLKHTDSHFCFP